MTHRGYRNIPGEGRLDSFRDYDHTPAAKLHHGPCRSCGTDTTISVTVGPPGHPRNGWECRICSERFLAQEMAWRDEQFKKSAAK